MTLTSSPPGGTRSKLEPSRADAQVPPLGPVEYISANLKKNEKKLKFNDIKSPRVGLVGFISFKFLFFSKSN